MVEARVSGQAALERAGLCGRLWTPACGEEGGLCVWGGCLFNLVRMWIMQGNIPERMTRGLSSLMSEWTVSTGPRDSCPCQLSNFSPKVEAVDCGL